MKSYVLLLLFLLIPVKITAGCDNGKSINFTPSAPPPPFAPHQKAPTGSHSPKHKKPSLLNQVSSSQMAYICQLASGLALLFSYMNSLNNPRYSELPFGEKNYEILRGVITGPLKKEFEIKMSLFALVITHIWYKMAD